MAWLPPSWEVRTKVSCDALTSVVGTSKPTLGESFQARADIFISSDEDSKPIVSQRSELQRNPYLVRRSRPFPPQQGGKARQFPGSAEHPVPRRLYAVCEVRNGGTLQCPSCSNRLQGIPHCIVFLRLPLRHNTTAAVGYIGT